MTTTRYFDSARLAPVGPHADGADPRVLAVADVDEDRLADHLCQLHNLPDDVATLFVRWFLDGLATWTDTDKEMTWAALVGAALALWRGSTPGPFTVTVVDDHEGEALADAHGDPWDPGVLPLPLDWPARAHVTGLGAGDGVRSLAVRPGTPRPLFRGEGRDTDGVVSRFVLVPRYVVLG